MMNPAAEVAMQMNNTGPLVLMRSEMKHTARRVTVANA